MNYILAKQYALRGYRSGKAPMLLNLKSGGKTPLTEAMASVLKMCDGKIDFDVLSIFKPLKQIAEKAAELGWVTEAENGDSLFEKQQYRELAVPGFEAVQWSITGRCNAKCRHCFVSTSQHRHRDLTTEEIVHILDVLAKNEVYHLSLTGGEPLLRPDLPILLREMAERHIKAATISTNGFLLNDRMLGIFEKNGMHPDFQISFDGVGHHDWMRGIKGAEEMAISAMDSCSRNGNAFILSMCVHRENIHLIPETVRLAEAHGANGIRIALVGDIGGFADNQGMTLMSLQEAAPYYLESLPEFCRRRPNMYIEFCGFMKIHGMHPEKYRIIPMIHNCTDQQNNQVCAAIQKAFYISDEGRMLPCIMTAGSSMEGDCYKLTEHSLEECMESPAYRMFLDLRPKELLRNNTECRDCAYFLHCGCGCRGQSVSTGNSLYGIDPDRCAFFRNNWPDRIRETMDRCLNT